MGTTSLHEPVQPQDRSEVFVGRSELLDAVLEDLDDVGALRVEDISGLLGAGKSSFLRWLHEFAEHAGTTVLVDMERYDPGYPGDLGERASIAAVQASFQFFAQLLQDLLADLRPGRVADMERATQLARNSVEKAKAQSPELRLTNTQNVGVGATVESSPLNISVTLGTRELADLWRKAACRVEDDFIGYANEDRGSRPVLLLVDNVDRCADQEIGPWFHNVLRRLKRAVVVLTREAGTALSVPGGVCRSRRLPPLSRTEVEEYLRQKVAPAPLDEAVAQHVYAFSGGHPAVVGLVYELVFGGGSEGHLTDVEKKISRMEGEPGERLALLVQSMVTRFAERRLDRALEAASVPRRFGTPLLHTLLGGEPGASDSETPGVLAELDRLTFTERVQGSDVTEFSLRVHPFVRTGLSEWMKKFNPNRFRELHELAASFYYDQLVKSDGSYGSWFQCENPAWQRDKSEWLYHLGHSGNQVEAFLEFTRVFLDVFWWWGNYVYFDFCDHLVRDFAHLADRTRSRDAAALAEALDTVLRAYPARSIKPRDAEWDTVRRALLTVRDLCGLRRRRSDWSQDQRHVTALIDVFLAHSWRYKDPTRPEADDWYGKADALFAENDDAWNMAWVAFERADLALDRGDVRDALARSAEAAVKVYRAAEDDELDDEIVGNLHRLRADCYWNLGDHERAAQLYGRGVVHAYRFHNTGGPPDEYTVQLYVEMRGRAISRVIELWDAGAADEAVRAAALMRDVVPSAWAPPAGRDAPLADILASGGVVELAHALFPRGPEWNEIGLPASPFMDEWRDVDAALDSFNEDLVPPTEPGGAPRP